jgi:hypothetical protein
VVASTTVLRQAGQHRADEEDGDRRLEGAAPAIQVGQLAPQRGDGGGGQQVGGHYPGQVVQAAEVADDRRQRGRDDGLVERGEQHAEHQPAEHDDDLSVAERTGPARAGPVVWVGTLSPAGRKLPCSFQLGGAGDACRQGQRASVPAATR